MSREELLLKIRSFNDQHVDFYETILGNDEPLSKLFSAIRAIIEN